MTQFKQNLVMPVAESKKCVKIENLKIARDPLHTDNYTTYSQAFQSTIHPEMKKLNKEACEQFNSLLRSVQTSVSYMKFENYLQAIKIFISYCQSLFNYKCSQMIKI